MRILLLVVLVLCGCSPTDSPQKMMRIGMDPSWYPMNFGAQNVYVNGFIDDLLLAFTEHTGLKIEKIEDNTGDLLAGLKKKKYDAILTTMDPYPFHLAQYEFSHNILNLGPVLVVLSEAPFKKLDQCAGGAVGVISNDPAGLIVQKHPEIFLRNYTSIPELLNAIVEGRIDGALLDHIPAVNYVSNLYAGKLKIVSLPLTSAGVRLISSKDQEDSPIRAFNESLKYLKKKKRLAELLKKWQL